MCTVITQITPQPANTVLPWHCTKVSTCSCQPQQLIQARSVHDHVIPSCAPATQDVVPPSQPHNNALWVGAASRHPMSCLGFQPAPTGGKQLTAPCSHTGMPIQTCCASTRSCHRMLQPGAFGLCKLARSNPQHLVPVQALTAEWQPVCTLTF